MLLFITEKSEPGYELIKSFGAFTFIYPKVKAFDKYLNFILIGLKMFEQGQ